VVAFLKKVGLIESFNIYLIQYVGYNNVGKVLLSEGIYLEIKFVRDEKLL
jgi:hypothetical protein